ncbi:TRAP transporter small permease subunit [Sphingomonas piscis]|uniref:TRAP transporter small permease protein n=1 Tax=Sphingomonas piscis TaxID=2714943 RepID=A0A6G7YM42_9SPHN|nr:TRAP transporter small permease subunit [Sphingomonas piscis]QIK77808.1 TRAP transporter small permease subunit [Sphingomonas piscis]
MTGARSIAVWFGGAALLAATAFDTVAVIGRQVGLPLRGSIELIQAAVLVAGCIALILATAVDRHARVRLVVDRIGEGARATWDSLSNLLTALFLLCLLIGSGWLAIDLWNSHEISEIAHVPWLWLRLFANVSLLIVTLIAFRRAFVRETRR